jgi:hypothetical protein
MIDGDSVVASHALPVLICPQVRVLTAYAGLIYSNVINMPVRVK